MSGALIDTARDKSLPAYDTFLEARLERVIKRCVDQGIKIISNQGWLDPLGAAERIAEIARARGVSGLKVAAVQVDGVDAELERQFDFGQLTDLDRKRVISAEPYLGAKAIAQALADGADVVVTSRVTDASLVLGPLVHELGWAWDDWDKLAHGVVMGHLLECGPQVCGGNICDPGYFDVPGLLDVGHPIGEISEEASILTKVEETGGFVNVTTCSAQLLWEVGDPTRYLNPDVVSDFTDVSFEDLGDDRVQVRGGKGAAPTDTLKTLVGVRDGFFSEEMILFAGLGALDKARLAEELVRERLQAMNFQPEAFRVDYVGINAIHREATESPREDVGEVALRLAARCESEAEIAKLLRVVAPMAVSGPIATGKWGTLAQRVRPVVGMRAILIPAAALAETITMVEV